MLFCNLLAITTFIIQVFFPFSQRQIIEKAVMYYLDIILFVSFDLQLTLLNHPNV